ncbi:MAG: HNH endonuclease [Cyanobacteria bacterium P01_G01_bin.39]
MSHQESERQPISKSIRFEIFKRDKFTCQYCGNKAPDAILHVDHINPVSKGGTNDLLNLITSCADCNLGKSNRTLADTTIIDRKRTQMDELQERRELIEMMMDWQRGLVELDQYLVEQVAEFWAELVEPYQLTDQGLKSLKKLLKQYNANKIMEAMRIATKQYLQYDNDQPTQESVSHAWSKIGGICKTKKLENSKPYMRELFYIRGILRKRLNYLNEWKCLKLLEKAYHCGASLEKLKQHACDVRNWTQWRQDMEAFIESYRETESESNSFNEFDEEVESADLNQKNENSDEDQTSREVIKQFIGTCNSFAEIKEYKKIAEMCNQYLDPNSLQVRDFIKDFNHWFITIQGNYFVVDLDRLQDFFNTQYSHWIIDHQSRCIYTLDVGYEYDIGFETIYSDERKLEWIQQLSSKTWSTPEMLTELFEILNDSLIHFICP